MDRQNESKENTLQEVLARARAIYTQKSEVYCPYFNQKIALTSDGFNHLQYKPNRQPRNVKVQILKLRLLRKALDVLSKTGTLQEYRQKIEKIGKRDERGFYQTKNVQYWGFHAILNGYKHKIKVIIRQVGDGKVMFWSVMPYDQKLYSVGMEEE